ncbi:HU family DNA-binding protein [Marinobacterium stanieri]|uniref:DNA-binding protein n=1 Tax=Marinobacterium stanieri TaxID=49186 RepID=A0A1N6RMT3_9GAMM|nr:DNA-binding protein [Marinobacterium stanieri]
MTQNSQYAGVITLEDLAKTLAFQVQMTEHQAYQALRAFGHIVVTAVAQDKAVQIEGFGMFDKGHKPNGEPAIRFRQHNSVREVLSHG